MAGRQLIMVPGTPMANTRVSYSDVTSLLVLDLQVDFLECNGRMPIAPEQIDQVLAMSNQAIEAATTHHMAIAYIGNEYTRWDIPGNWFRHNAAPAGTPGAALDPHVKRVSEAGYFPKRQADAFSSSELEGFLRQHRIRRLVICGVYADACVAATARGALRRAFAVIVLSDAVGAASDTARQSALVKILQAGGQIKTTGEFINGLGATSRAVE
jgi:nicotinamidase-related amidase